MSGDSGPPLLRPVPRRPFGLNLTSPTPPDEDSPPPSPGGDATNPRLLDPRPNGSASALDGGSLSRAQSIMNLTASTLFGIYSPSTWGRDRDRYAGDRDEPTTPWGTGAQTPTKRLSVDEPNYEVMKDRSAPPRTLASPQGLGIMGMGQAPPAPPSSTAAVVVSLVLRAALLFGLGMGYGVLVTQLHHSERDLTSFSVEKIIPPGYDWRYLAFWGSYGVALGGLLPWFDGVWEANFGKSDEVVRKGEGSGAKSNPETDWALVIRGIGAFVGIVFAIRKLPWASTMQVSMTLALVNPFLWYLIDRSKPGFILSAAVGITGSAAIMGLNPTMMPTPTGLSSSSVYGNGTGSSSHAGSPSSSSSPLGSFASQETFEMGIWVLSVLFCSCVCFGNIGRRLALNRSASGRGRWGGVR